VITKDQFGFNAFWWEVLHTQDQMKTCADCLAGLGYKFVEFKRLSFKQDDIAAEFKMAAEAAQAAGIEVSNFVVLRSLNTGDRQAIEDVIETVQACSEAGVDVLNTICGPLPAPRETAPEEWWMPGQALHQCAWDNVIPALEAVCEAADKVHVDLAIEPIAGSLVHDLYSFQELFSRFDHPRLGVTFDPSHFLLHRNDIPYALDRLGDRIRHVHMKDAVGRPGVFGLDFLFPALGAGGVDWKAFFAALDKIDYKGAISGEYEQFKYMAHVRGNDPQYAARVMYEEMTALHDLAYK
jgi:sugar phosphate isomerase/epimerase